MGLVDCVDCGAKHSDADNTICPQCGRPWGTEDGRRTKAYINALDRLIKERQYAFERELHDPRTNLSEMLKKYKLLPESDWRWIDKVVMIEAIEAEIVKRHGESALPYLSQLKRFIFAATFLGLVWYFIILPLWSFIQPLFREGILSW